MMLSKIMVGQTGGYNPTLLQEDSSELRIQSTQNPDPTSPACTDSHLFMFLCKTSSFSFHLMNTRDIQKQGCMMLVTAVINEDNRLT